MVTAGFSAAAAGGSDARAGGFVRQIAADLCDALVDALKEDGFLIFDKAREMARRTFGEKESFAGGDLEALVHELVVIGMREEAEVNLRTPDAFAIVVAEELAVAAVKRGSGFGAEGLDRKSVV